MKKKTCHRDAAYLDYIRSQPCMVSGSTLEVVAHHVRCLGGGGMGIKPSDYLCVPLTAELHAQLHQMGEWTFYEQNMIDIESAIKMRLLIYMAQHNKITYKDLISVVENF